MARDREYRFFQKGTVVQDDRTPSQWGIILSADEDLRHFTVRWRGAGDEEHVPWTVLTRAAAPCAECGERAGAHGNVTHKFVKETY